MAEVLGNVTSWLRWESQLALSDPWAATREFWTTFGPGGKLHPGAFIEHRYHLVIEAALLLGIVWLLVQSRAPPPPPKEALTDKEIDDLVAEWRPAPLVPETGLAREDIRTPVVDCLPGARVTVDGRAGVLNLASYNFWGIVQQGHPQDAAAKALDRYGVGACGPRAFYGTIDVHLELERRLARFMGTEEAILYSYDVATMPSVLPAFASRKDLIVIDEACAWPQHNGALLSRAKVVTYKHNDVADLERVMRAAVRAARGKPLARRFIVCEGISHATGDAAPLAAIFALKQRYKFRLVVDETLSFGVLGAGGRGAAEAAGLAPQDVEITTGSLGTGLASAGGWCVGARVMVDHQRLSGSGYCFSAALPPMLAAAALDVLGRFEAGGAAAAAAVRRNAAALRAAVAGVEGVRIRAAAAAAASDGGLAAEAAAAAAAATRESPLVLLEPEMPEWTSQEDLLRCAVSLRDVLLDEGRVLVGLDRPTELHRGDVWACAALRVTVTAAHTEADIAEFVAALRAALDLLAGPFDD